MGSDLVGLGVGGGDAVAIGDGYGGCTVHDWAWDLTGEVERGGSS